VPKYNVHVTDGEKINVIRHYMTQGAFTPKGKEEILGLSDMMEDLGLSEDLEILNAGVGLDKIDKRYAEASRAEVHELSLATVDFFLTKFVETPMASHVACQLAKLIRRFQDAKKGEYKAPGKIED